MPRLSILDDSNSSFTMYTVDATTVGDLRQEKEYTNHSIIVNGDTSPADNGVVLRDGDRVVAISGNKTGG